MSTIYGLLILFTGLAVFSVAFYNKRVISRAFVGIIKYHSVDWAFIIALIRSVHAFIIPGELAAIFMLYYSIAVIPQTISGNLTGTISSTNNLSGEILLNPDFSLDLTILAIIAASIAGATVALFIQQMMNMQRISYLHLRNNLFKLVNRSLCNNSNVVEHAIREMPLEFDPLKAREIVSSILILMAEHQSLSGSQRKK